MYFTSRFLHFRISILTLLEIGDATQIHRVLENNIKGKSPESVLALGDYSYQPTATCWLNIINPTKSTTRINIGNHENDANEDNSKYMSQFGLTKQYYSFDYQMETGGPKVHVLTMATELSISKGSSQYNFVLSDLQKASTDPTIKWIIVNYHRVMYTSPNTCSSSSCAGSSVLGTLIILCLINTG